MTRDFLGREFFPISTGFRQDFSKSSFSLPPPPRLVRAALFSQVFMSSRRCTARSGCICIFGSGQERCDRLQWQSGILQRTDHCAATSTFAHQEQPKLLCCVRGFILLLLDWGRCRRQSAISNAQHVGRLICGSLSVAVMAVFSKTATAPTRSFCDVASSIKSGMRESFSQSTLRRGG